MHLSIPPAPSNLTELSDEDLEKVAGGKDIVASIVAAVTGALVSGGLASGISAGVTHSQGW